MMEPSIHESFKKKVSGANVFEIHQVEQYPTRDVEEESDSDDENRAKKRAKKSTKDKNKPRTRSKNARKKTKKINKPFGRVW
jgi:hypothetical protein